MQFIVTGYDGKMKVHWTDEWLDIEPYILEKVWEKVEITRAQVAPLFDKK